MEGAVEGMAEGSTGGMAEGPAVGLSVASSTTIRESATNKPSTMVTRTVCRPGILPSYPNWYRKDCPTNNSSTVTNHTIINGHEQHATRTSRLKEYHRANDLHVV
jgi:hypothetical protein